MKIPIKIGSKKYIIKSIDELTTSEFIELSKIENLDTTKYIAWQTKTNMSDAFFAVIDNTIEKAIGQIHDVSKVHRPKLKYIDYSKLIDTVGQRHQIESSNTIGYELLVLCLAVSQARSANIDDVNKLKADYMQRPFLEVLPAGFFFFKSLQPGKKREVIYFLKLKVLTKIRTLRKLLAPKD